MVPTFTVNADIHKRMDKITKLNLNPSNEKDREHLGETVLYILDSKKEKANPMQSAYTKRLEVAAHYKRFEEVSLLDNEEMVSGYKGVSYDYFTDNNSQNELERVERLVDIKYIIPEFLEMREFVYLEDGKDIWWLLYLQKTGDKKAERKLKWVIEEYDRLGELLEYILKTPECFCKLEAMLN